ncbi:serine-threonine protein kinase 19, partial [Lasiosphaeris hirsuta]
PSASAWASSLPRTKAGGNTAAKSNVSRAHDDELDDDYFHDRLDDFGLVQALAADLHLRDVVQAQLWIRAHMFDPIPDRGSGMNSAKTAAVLNFRDALPPVASSAHVRALLASPTAAEREMAELVRAGTLRRVVVPRRVDVGELVVLSRDLEGLVRGSKLLDEGTKEAFVKWLGEQPAAQTMPGDALARSQVDALVRAGFLTALNDAAGRSTGVFARPAERHAMLSLETVSRAAAGSLAAVGGEGALHAAGGTGGRSGFGGLLGVSGEVNVAVPGIGMFLKLVSGALARLADLLHKTRYREMPESDLREKWGGGIAGDKQAALAKKARGEFIGVLPGRTKKWRDFNGLSFDWVLREAVGAGLVEVFETSSVGRGVR